MNNAQRYQSILTLVLGCALFAASRATAQNDSAPDVLLQRAIQKEMVDGDLPAAIDLYKTVASARAASRAVTAKALYQLGQAHEKLGSTEARKAYERIAREFADQKDVAADAGRRLAAMSGGASSNGHHPRAVATPGNTNEVSFSFDGRWLTATVWGSGDDGGDNRLVIQNLATGETKQVLRGSCGSARPCTFSDEAILSPDGRYIAYSWYDDAEIDGKGQLRLVSTEDGATPRVLVRNPEFTVWTQAWAPDGKSILVMMRNRDRVVQLAWASVADGTLKMIKSLDWRRASHSGVSVSPDGRYIAYAALATNPKSPATAPNDPTDTHIYLLASDGSSEVTLVKTAGTNKSPVWMPDGSRVAFTSNLSGKTDLWSIAVQDGKAAGSPVLLKRNIGEVQSVGITKAGTYYYQDRQRRTDVENIVLAEFIPGSGSRVLESFVGLNPRWSPDGKALAFKRHTPQSEEWHNVVVRSLGTDQETTFYRDSIRADPPRWRHDGKSLLTLAGTAPESGNQWWHVLDLPAKTFTRAILRGDFRGGIAAISPDDKFLYTVARDRSDKSNKWDRVVAVEIANGNEREVFRFPGTAETHPIPSGIGIAASPDGRNLALAVRNPKSLETRLLSVEVDSGKHRELFGPYSAGATFDKLTWTKDSTIFFAMSGEDRSSKIMRLRSVGGTPEFTGLTIKDLRTFDVSPDGTRIAYSTEPQRLHSAPVLFAIDNLPALLRAAK
jgi:Tol biopolymer transport system component